jgi:SAM-dependent methyltransferase
MSYKARYQDFVIKDGKLIGDFEGLYKNFDDPWLQSTVDPTHDSRRNLAVSWCNRLRDQFEVHKTIELGCGFGHLTETLRKQNFSSVGIDVSITAIEKARALNPSSVFAPGGIQNFSLIEQFDPDIMLMSEITWYVLDEIDEFLKNLKDFTSKRKKPTFLIHLLTTYAPGIQKYGADKFTNLDEILVYFNLNYLESGSIRTSRESDPELQGTYFVAKI